ncbi:MAG: FlgO family outer membrane protein [Burkholderiaceae bacterium]
MAEFSLYLRLLGEFDVCDASGEAISISSKKSRALLAYLACVQGNATTRDQLAHLLWSHTDAEFGKTNLRQLLSALRKQLQHASPPILLARQASLLLDTGAAWTDVANFMDFTTAESVETLEAAAGLYRGDLLQGFPLISDAFDEWLAIERVRYRQRFIGMVQRLLDIYADVGASDKLGFHANRLLDADGTNEHAHRALMRMYLMADDRRRAVQQYEICRNELRSQLDIEPSMESQALYQSMREVRVTSEAEHATSRSGDTDSQIHRDFVDVASDQPLSEPTATTEGDEAVAGPAQCVDEPHATPIGQRPPRSGWLTRAGHYRYSRTSLIAAVPVGLLAIVQYWYPSSIWQAPPDPRQLASQKESQLGVPPGIADSGLLADAGLRLSVAVLPFKNLGDDDDSVYFSDGLSEDITTELSRLSGLKVLASQSSFLYREQQGDVAAIQGALSVDYLLMGTVRRVDQTVRVTARLVRVADSVNVWSTKIDRSVTDILAMQDEITRAIVGALSIKLTDTERKRLSIRRAVSAQAYDLLLRGLHPFSQITEEGIDQARVLFRKAIDVDSSYARPYANMALSYGREVVFQLEEHKPEAIESGLEYAAKAEALDPSLPQTQFARAVLSLANRDFQSALSAARRAIALDGNYADGYAVLAQTSAYSGELDVALEAINRAKSLNPVVPYMYHWVEGNILYNLRRYADAARALERVYAANPTFFMGLLTLCATYGQMGNADEAQWLREELLTLRPALSARRESASAPYRFDHYKAHFLEGMLKAGLPQ